MQSMTSSLARRARWCRAVAAAAGLALVPMAGAHAQSSGSDMAGPAIYVGDEKGATTAAGPDALLSLARDRGAVRVIVGFDVDFQPEGNLSEPELAGQRDAIAAGQDEILAVLSAAEDVTRFETVPYIAAKLGARDLERIMAAPGVTSIHEDIPVPPALDESVSLVKAPRLWADGIEGTGQAVAVLDTGVRWRHASMFDRFGNSKVVASACFSTTDSAYPSSTLCPDGADEMRRGSNGVAGEDCDTSINGCGHGTHVASIASGRYLGHDGVARKSNVVSVQVFSRFDSTAYCGSSSPCALSFSSDQMKGLEFVAKWSNRYNIASANMSLGGGGTSSPCSNNPLVPIIDTLRSRGVATVIASGNAGYSDGVDAPGCIPAAITVGSTTKSDDVSSFSNHDEMVDIMAPGSSIEAADADGTRGALTTKSGTSMATPHVAGAFALLKSAKPDASVEEIERALKCKGVPTTAVNLPRPRFRAAHANVALQNPVLERRWDFRTDRQVDSWTQVLGNWMRVGRAMHVSASRNHTWYMAQSPFCADDLVIHTMMKREDPDSTLEWPSGVFISNYADGAGNFSGLMFSYSIAEGPDGDQTLVEIAEVGGWSGTDDSGGDFNVLCGDAFFGRSLGSPRVLRIVKRGNELSFALDGTTVCTAQTDSRFTHGKVAVFMQAPANSPGHTLDVSAINMRALGAIAQ